MLPAKPRLRVVDHGFRRLCLVAALASANAAALWAEEPIRSHPPMRALPRPSQRSISAGPAYFVDPAQGSDSAPGSRQRPFKTLARALQAVKPGDTIYLRGGVYYEQAVISARATPDRPITIRSYPGELAVLDGGLAEFSLAPATAWEPDPAAEGLYRSSRTYPGLGEIVLGHFADSMVPLHGYRHRIDLTSHNEYWQVQDKLDAESGIYCGPGLWYEATTGRIYARLAHQHLAALGPERYAGETDPRRLRLIVGRPESTLKLSGGCYLRLQDLVVRGSSGTTVEVEGCHDIELDGLVVYGGALGLRVRETSRLRMVDCALRSIAAPWSGRVHLKYRGIPAYLLWFGEACKDFEVAYCELVDGHDGLFVGPVQNLLFHHNLVENFNDDGIYLTAMEIGGNVHIYQNRLARCLTTFSFYGAYAPGNGVYIYRNLIDLREPVYYQWPQSPDDPAFAGADGCTASFPAAGGLCGEHGSPIWEPVYFYHNTIVSRVHPEYRGYYAGGWAGHTRGTTRRVFNNIFVELETAPGFSLPGAVEDDFLADHNLHWGMNVSPDDAQALLREFHQSPAFLARQRAHASGWAIHDIIADPRFLRLERDWREAADWRLQQGSPAVDAGAELPADWPDPLRERDAGRPDLGALPLGAEMFAVGPRVK